jgi:hypothetical protein
MSDVDAPILADELLYVGPVQISAWATAFADGENTVPVDSTGAAAETPDLTNVPQLVTGLQRLIDIAQMLIVA